MKSVFVATLLVLGAFCWDGTGSAAEPDTYLFDVLRHSQYHFELARLLKGKPVPDWVEAFLKEGDGVASPSKTLEISGKSYRLDHLCKAHDCAGNLMVVLWAPKGLRAWVALVEGGGAPTLLGNPSPEQAEALTAAVKGT